MITIQLTQQQLDEIKKAGILDKEFIKEGQNFWFLKSYRIRPLKSDNPNPISFYPVQKKEEFELIRFDDNHMTFV